MNNLLLILIYASLCMLVEPSPSMQTPTYNDHDQDHAVFLPLNYQKLSCPDGNGADCIHHEMTKIEAELSRRILADAGYISYGALQRDSIPCNVRGNSYYNCHSNQQANPYSRSCTKITYCARNNH